MLKTGAVQRCIAELLAKAKEFREAFGDEPRARSPEWAAARIEQALRDDSDQLLTLPQAAELTPERMAGYATARRSGQINGRAVGATALHQDIKLLKSMMKWATGVYNNGRPLLDRNPLTGFAIPKTRNPIRPLIDAELEQGPLASQLETGPPTRGVRSGVRRCYFGRFSYQSSTTRGRPNIA